MLALSPIIYSPSAAFAASTPTEAQQAFLIDLNTHTVMLNKNGDVEMHPSSMSKLMTIYILFSRLKEGRLHLDDKFTVSEKAWRTQGSKTFVGIGSEMTIDQLIHGIIIQSGNDACIVVAEGISGTEEAFVQEMNRQAKELGLTKSHFANATGLPDDTHLMSARDLATLAEHIMTEFPEYYHYFSIREYTYNNITQHNRNLLLSRNIGADGLKTGHTDAGGFGITASAKQGDRRLILVVNGLTSEKERIDEADRLLRWGFREFEDKTIIHKGQKVADAQVWFGKKPAVPLVTDSNVLLTVPVSGASGVSMTLKYTGPIPAPVAQGAHVADLIIKSEGSDPKVIPLLAAEEVPRLSGPRRLIAVIKHFLHRH